MIGPLDIELNDLHYVVREVKPGVWAVWYNSHIMKYLTLFEVALMLSAYKQGQLALP